MRLGLEPWWQDKSCRRIHWVMAAPPRLLIFVIKNNVLGKCSANQQKALKSFHNTDVDLHCNETDNPWKSIFKGNISHKLWPDWVTFKRSWQQLFSCKTAQFKILQLFQGIFKSVTRSKICFDFLAVFDKIGQLCIKISGHTGCWGLFFHAWCTRDADQFVWFCTFELL